MPVEKMYPTYHRVINVQSTRNWLCGIKCIVRKHKVRGFEVAACDIGLVLNFDIMDLFDKYLCLC